MKEGGFLLRKWKTSEPDLAQKIDHEEGTENETAVRVERAEESYAKTYLGASDSQRTTKILGITWNNVQDNFEFDLGKWASRSDETSITKRSILRQIARLFDPLGLVSPITVQAKALFQELCIEKLGWDEKLPEAKKEQWHRWVSDLKVVDKITIPRCLYEEKNEEIKSCYLHGFGDASKKAYCAMIYLVYETSEGYHSRLICSKTRVAPLKDLSIPRLELMSARILATLMDTVRNALSSQVRIDGVKYWLDSKTALYWIYNNGEWRQFVQHRVNEILKLSNKEDWGHCPGVQNPADLGSRGVTAATLSNSSLWWEGPEWLIKGKELWADDFELQETQDISAERKKTAVLATIAMQETGIHKVMDISRFSTLNRLLRVTAIVMRFIRNLKSKVKREEIKTGKINVQEIQNAEKSWIIGAQQTLRNSANFPKTSIELGIFEEGEILKCRGRLEHADLEPGARYPIILPRDHRLTILIVLDCHCRVLHDGFKSTLAELRSKFWITKGYVKKLVNKCVTCKKLQGKHFDAPTTAPLPEFRVSEAAPFSRIGIDFAGPLYVKDKSNVMQKHYIALFTCCVTRAIHLELVEDLSTSTFIRSFRRFTARRGTPSLINSDNAKTFKAAKKFLDKLFVDQQFLTFLHSRRIVWKFNLALSPWQGGHFERLVGSVKRTLRKVLGNAKLRHDEIHTVLVEIEGILNSRPLTYSYDEVGFDVLTPFHLMYGRRLSQLTDFVDTGEQEEESSTLMNKRFLYLVKKLDHFWKRWRGEYLIDLRESHRCRSEETSDAKVGDVVLIHEDNVKRNQWKMGLIDDLIQGKDGQIRGAKVRIISRGKPDFIDRPLQKLFPLEVCDGTERNVDRGERKKSEVNIETERPRERSARAAAKDARWKSRIMLDSY